MREIANALVIIVIILTIGGCHMFGMYNVNKTTQKNMELELKKVELQLKMYKGE